MKKIIKRVLLLILVVAIAFYLYKLGLMLYVYNKIDKNIAKNFEGDYSVKMILDKGRTIQNWYSKDYGKTTISVEGNSVVSNKWFDFNNKQVIFQMNENELRIDFYNDREEMLMFPKFEGNSDFASGYSMNSIKEAWSNWKDWGLLNAIYSTVVMPFVSVDSVKTEEIDGREYFVVTSKAFGTKKYIDKETYLPFKYISLYDESYMDYRYEFSFDTITKESLEFPNIDEYYVTMY